MKVISVIFAAAAISGNVFAADILLKDGRVLKDATIKSQAPRTITIRHAGGLSSVAKDLLPSEFQAQYPIDEAAAIEADRRAAIAREAAQEFHKKEAERVALLHKRHESDSIENEANQAKDAADQKLTAQAAKGNASALAAHYFEYDYAPGSTCDVTISDVRPLEGSAGRWLVRGSVLIRKSGTRQNWTDTSPIGDADWRRLYNENNRQYNDEDRRREAYPRDHSEPPPGGEPRHQNDANRSPYDENNDTGHAHRREQRERVIDPYYRDQDRTDYTYTPTPELKEFEGTYSSEDAQPTIDITVR
jgi:hypothetical protein